MKDLCGMCDGTGLMEGWNRRDGYSCPECKGVQSRAEEDGFVPDETLQYFAKYKCGFDGFNNQSLKAHTYWMAKEILDLRSALTQQTAPKK
jgi:hypothetical protein